MITREDDVDIHALRRQGWTITAIARHVGRDRKTVRDYLNGKREPGVRQRAVASVGHHLVRRTSGFGLRGVVSDVDSGDPGPPPATGLRRLRPGHGAGERDHPAPIYSMIFRRINGTARLSRRRTTSPSL